MSFSTVIFGSILAFIFGYLSLRYLAKLVERRIAKMLTDRLAELDAKRSILLNFPSLASNKKEKVSEEALLEMAAYIQVAAKVVVTAHEVADDAVKREITASGINHFMDGVERYCPEVAAKIDRNELFTVMQTYDPYNNHPDYPEDLVLSIGLSLLFDAAYSNPDAEEVNETAWEIRSREEVPYTLLNIAIDPSNIATLTSDPHTSLERRIEWAIAHKAYGPALALIGEFTFSSTQQLRSSLNGEKNMNTKEAAKIAGRGLDYLATVVEVEDSEESAKIREQKRIVESGQVKNEGYFKYLTALCEVAASYSCANDVIHLMEGKTDVFSFIEEMAEEHLKEAQQRKK